MKNLKNSGLALRTIQPKEYNSLIEDLNFNFLQILSLPSFKGLKGEAIKGDIGEGVRGTKWIFVSISDFADKGVVSENDITLTKINEWYTQDSQDFINHLNIPNDSELIYGDILVLPNGEVIQLVKTNSGDKFIDTNISFSQVSQLTTEDVTNIVRQLIGDQDSKDGFRFFKAIAKNASDNSPNMNNNLTNDSVIDIDVVGSGVGVEMANYKFLAPNSVDVTENDRVMLISGSSDIYHKLIQATQNQFNNDYACGVDDWGAMALLQNSNKNGLLLGSRDAQTFRDFARIYKSSTALTLTSSYSPNNDEFGEIQLSDIETVLRNKKTTIDSNELIHIGKLFSTHGINIDLNELLIGNDALKVVLKTPKGLFLDNIKSVEILTTDSDGRVISKYSITNTINSASTDTELPTAKSVYTELNLIDIQLTNHENRIIALENQDLSNVYKANEWVLGNNDDSLFIDLNDYIEMGLFGFNNRRNLVNTPVPYSPPTNGQVAIADTYSRDCTLSVKFIKGDNLSGNILEFIEQEFTITNTPFYIGGEQAPTGINKFVRIGKKLNNEIKWTNWESIFTSSSNINRKITDLENKTAMMGVGHIIMKYQKPQNVLIRGWALCDGRGGTPDMRGRFPVGFDATDTDYNAINKRGGLKEVKLTENHLPSHNHNTTISRHDGHFHNYEDSYRMDIANASNVEIDGSTSGYNNKKYQRDSGTSNCWLYWRINSTARGGEHTHTATVSKVGGDEAHENRPPYQTLTFYMYVGDTFTLQQAVNDNSQFLESTI